MGQQYKVINRVDKPGGMWADIKDLANFVGTGETAAPMRVVAAPGQAPIPVPEDAPKPGSPIWNMLLNREQAANPNVSADVPMYPPGKAPLPEIDPQSLRNLNNGMRQVR